jgi:hypothetical protein
LPPRFAHRALPARASASASLPSSPPAPETAAQDDRCCSYVKHGIGSVAGDRWRAQIGLYVVGLGCVVVDDVVRGLFGASRFNAPSTHPNLSGELGVTPPKLRAD